MKKKCCQLPFRSWCRRPASMLQKLSEKNTIITKEPNVSSWALWDSRCIVISRIFCLWRFCPYTDHPRKKEGWKNMVGIISVHSVLCPVSHRHTNSSPDSAPKRRMWMYLHHCGTGQGRSRVHACACCWLMLYSTSCRQKGAYYLNAKLQFTCSLIKALTV